MTRVTRAWGALEPEQRLAGIAAVALLVTMFFPWYQLQSLNSKTGTINSRSISAFGDVSFVEAAVFLVAAGVIALLFARGERRQFHLPGSDGTIVMIAGGWAALLIFYRVFDRPSGHGYPVGIQWGFFLAFVAAGVLTYAGWRMHATSTPEPPLLREREHRRRRTVASEESTVVTPARSPRPAPTRSSDPSSRTADPTSDPSPRPPQPRSPAQKRTRPRFPPGPSGQLSFEDSPEEQDPPAREGS